jgi:hypothetical protein
MELKRDGSRHRRKGFNLETNFMSVVAPIPLRNDEYLGRSQFRWYNPGGKIGFQYLVVQIGNHINIHDVSAPVLSQSVIYSKTFDSRTYSTNYGYAVVDGTLVIATGEKDIYIFSDVEGTITERTKRLLIRDFFGVEAVVDGTELTDPLFLQTRPTDLSREHIYNLRNQTFALPRYDGKDNTLDTYDPIKFFFDETEGIYPSNADSVIPFLTADPNFSTNRTAERFNPITMKDTPPNNSPAPKGYFIIDALDRGTSRQAQIDNLYSRHELSFPVEDLPPDVSTNGPSILTQYAGRVWYAGFQGETVNGDSKSPNLSSYVMFSQLVQSTSQINLCYQLADPTSHIDSDVVETDGGFIKIDGAFGIKALVPVGTSLFVLAENGVWRIVGIDENAFNAVSYSVSKVSEEGCLNGYSAVTNGSSLVYWGYSGIFLVQQNQLGSWQASNISETTVQTFYESLSSYDKISVIGYYDMTNNQIRWVYGFNPEVDGPSNELILNLRYSAFTFNTINQPQSQVGVLSISGGQKIGLSQTSDVYVGPELVTVDDIGVFILFSNAPRDTPTSFYCCVLAASTNISYTFGGYVDEDFYDWNSIDLPVDTPAIIVTGAITGGRASGRKGVPYVNTFFQRTESLDTARSSSCVFSTQWEWSLNSLSGKWSTPRQAYRLMSTDNNDKILSTKNKVRGMGKSVAFKFESEPGKDMRIYGWEFNLDANSIA